MSLQRVLLIGPDPDGLGGIETVLRSYLTLSSERFLFSSLTTWNGTSAVRDRFVFVRSLVTFVISSGMLRRNRTYVHVHLSHQGSFVREGLFVVLSRLLGIRVFATIHGSAFVRSSEKNPVLRLLYRFVLKSADRVGVLNSMTHRTLVGMKICRIAVLPNPGPVPIDTQIIPAGKNEPIAVFAGTVGRRKGADTLLAAWDIVLKEMPNAKLMILGPASDIDVVERAGESWLGPAQPSAVWEALSKSRVAVLPSTAEAMPMFVIEAMGCGRPMVVTDVGAMSTQVNGWGKVVPVGDLDKLAEALLVYLRDPEFSTSQGYIAYERYERLYGPREVDSNLNLFYSGADLASSEAC